MVTTEEAQQSVLRARQQTSQAREETEQARQLLAQRKQEASQELVRLARVASGLPETGSQMALRQRLQGVQGREFRRSVQSAKEELARRQAGVGQFESQLQEFETAIEGREVEIKSAEANIESVKRSILQSQETANAFDTAQKLVQRGVATRLIEDPLTRDFAREIRRGQAFAAQAQALVENPEALQLELDRLAAGGVSESQALANLGLQLAPIEAEIPQMDAVISGIPRIEDRVLQAQIRDGIVMPSTEEPTTFFGRASELILGRQVGRAGETFVPQLGAFISPSVTGVGATGQIRQPTIEERQIIQRAQLRGDLLSIPAAEVVSKTNKFRELSQGLETLEGTNLTVRIEELKAIGARITETPVNGETQLRIDPPTVGVGVGADKTQVPISELDTRTQSTVTASAAALIIGRGAERGARAVGIPEEGLVQIPEQEVTVFEPIFGTGQINVLTGEVRGETQREITVPERQLVTPSQIGGAAEIGTRIITFVPELGGSAGEILARQEPTAAGFGRGILEFVRTFPVETVVVGTLGVASLVAKVGKGLKLTKEAKFLTLPEAKVVRLESEKIIENTIRGTRKRPSFTASADEIALKVDINIKPKAKGTIRETELIPSKELLGTVRETRDIGRRRISFVRGETFLQSKVRVEPVLKEFRGKARLTADGRYVETLELEGGLRRVTSINKEGKGTIKLVDKEGKTISSDVINARSTSEIKLAQTKEEQILIDEQFQNPLSITQVDVRRGAKRLQKQKVVDQQGNLVVTDNPLDLRATLIKGDVRTVTTSGVNRQTGEFKIIEDTAGFTDVITAGERKALKQIKEGDVNLIVRKRQGQTIEFGTDQELDRVLRLRTQGQEVVERQISPSIERTLVEGQEQKLTLGFINPRGELRKILENPSTNKQKIKELEKLVKDKSKSGFKADVEKIKTQIKNLKEETAKILKKKDGEVVQVPIVSETLPSVVRVPSAEEILGGRLPPVAPPTVPSLFSITPQITTRVGGVSTFVLGARTLPAQNGAQMLEVPTQEALRQPAVTQEFLPLQVQQPVQEAVLEIAEATRMRGQEMIMDVVGEALRQPVTQRELARQQARQLLSMEQVQLTRTQERVRPRLAEEIIGRETVIGEPLRAAIPEEERPMVEEMIETAKTFEAVSKRRGKEISLGFFETQRGAESELKEFLTGTLAASGSVKKSGEKIPVSKLDLFGENMFRSAKKDIFTIVERKQFRLDSPAEVSELQFFKKPKKRRKK